MNLGGRPRKFQNVEEIADKIDKYFKSITKTELAFETKIVGYEDEEKKKPIFEQIPILNDNNEQIINKIYFEEPTITGLCIFLDITNETLNQYEKLEGFSETIKKAKHRIENFLEHKLYRSEQVTGVIFNLKNNFGWKDKQEVENTNTNLNANLDINIDDVERIKQQLVKEYNVKLLEDK